MKTRREAFDRRDAPMFAGFVGLVDTLVGASLVNRVVGPMEMTSAGPATPGCGV
jgi:hypothetical protein